MSIQNNTRKQVNNTNTHKIVTISLIADTFDLFIDQGTFIILYVLSLQKDREERIWKLLIEGATYREICEIEHCSPNEVSKVYKKKTGENTKAKKNMKSKSQCSQALNLLQKGVPLIDVIIILDIDPEQVKNYHDIYLYLTKREKIVSLLKMEKTRILKSKYLNILIENPPELRKIRENEHTHIEVWVDPHGWR